MSSHRATAQDIMTLKPAGWTLQPHDPTYGGKTFVSPDGDGEANVDTVNPEPDLATSATTAMMNVRPMGGDEVTRQPARKMAELNAVLVMGAWDWNNTRYMVAGLATPSAQGRTFTCGFRTRFANPPPKEMNAFLGSCVAAAQAGAFVYDSDVQTARARAAVASTPMSAGTGKAVEATVLEVYYKSGFGGMPIPDYRPVVLFKDGFAIRNFAQPVGEIDLARFVKAQPDDVARWTRTARGFSLQWPDEREPNTIEASVERPGRVAPNARIAGYWKRSGGGGNSSLGGDVAVSVSNGYRFFADGRFATDRAIAGSAPGVFGGSTGSDGGTYRLGGSVLVLSYADGHTQRLSIYRGGGAAPVLWIGGDSYVP